VTADDLAPLLEFWQRQLRIQDWDVRLSVVRYHQIPGTLGQCKARVGSRQAIVSICDPDDIHPDASGADRDPEVTLVHELLHVAFPADMEDGTASTTQEQAIDATARALVLLRRGTPR